MAVDTCLRTFHYFSYKLQQTAWIQINQIDEELKKPQSSSLRVALSAIFYFGSVLVTCLLSWKWVVAAYTVQTLLDMYVLPRARGQRWDEIMHQGLNFGLAIRASYLILTGIFQLSPLSLIQGLFLGGGLFFKEDWDQFDWGSYYHSAPESIASETPFVASSFKEIAPSPSLLPFSSSRTSTPVPLLPA